jgi:membrane protein DedA with SNARE-associated domain
VAERCDRIFHRYGSGAVLVARLLPLARTFVSLPAGRAGVPLPTFVLLTVIGCAIWSAGFVLAGDLAGDAWRSASGVASRAALAAGALLLIWLWLGGRRRD